MNALWLKGKPDTFKESVMMSADVLEQLSRLLTEMEKREKGEVDYDSASWAYKQAHRNGYNKAIAEIKELIKI